MRPVLSQVQKASGVFVFTVMARSRNIKPGLFKNELLGTEDPLLTLLFIGLWCLADKEGRLEDRPLRIRAEIFPYRDIELSLFNASLTKLASLGFIWRYEVSGQKIIEVCKFKKHQSPHSTEKASELPPYVSDNKRDTDLTEVVALDNESLTQAERSDSLLLIPDSLTLIPASAKREISDNTEQNQRTEINGKSAIPVNPVSKEETEQIESFLTEIRSAYNTNSLGNEPRWVDSVLDAIASGLTPKQYSDAARCLLTDKSRKYPITPANVLALAIEQRAKKSGVKAPAKNGGFLH